MEKIRIKEFFSEETKFVKQNSRKSAQKGLSEN
jgi:hypothetical protein